MLRVLATAGVLAALFGCAEERDLSPRPDKAFLDSAIGYLGVVQISSFAIGIEVCGLMGYDSDGAFVATPAAFGTEGYCDITEPPEGLDVVASYHTHGNFDRNYVAEVPSVMDVEGDMAEGTWGLLSTPGGRIWLIDPATGRSEQLCSLSCVTPDPSFVSGVDGPIAQSYTRAELEAFLGSF